MNPRSLAPVALVMLGTLCAAAGCTPSSGNGSSSGSSGASSGGSSGGTGSVQAGLVGIWQQTATATGSDGYAALLKVRANGQFVFQYFSPTAVDCPSGDTLDSSEGTLELTSERLVLRPTKRTVQIRGCGKDETTTLGNDALEFTVNVSPYETLIKENTLAAELTGGLAHPLKLKLLQQEPSDDIPQPPQPASFQLGSDPPYAELQGLWAPSSGSDTNFYNPQTGEFYIPKYNAAQHDWLKFVPGGSEFAAAFENANIEGTCKKDLVYYESGSALFKVLDVTNGTSTGDARFEAKDARLVVNIRGCGEDDGAKTYTLKPLTSYFKWQHNAAIGFLIGCDYPKNNWNFAICQNNVGYNTFKKR
jgi:hypothetical protein